MENREQQKQKIGVKPTKQDNCGNMRWGKGYKVWVEREGQSQNKGSLWEQKKHFSTHVLNRWCLRMALFTISTHANAPCWNTAQEICDRIWVGLKFLITENNWNYFTIFIHPLMSCTFLLGLICPLILTWNQISNQISNFHFLNKIVNAAITMSTSHQHLPSWHIFYFYAVFHPC